MNLKINSLDFVPINIKQPNKKEAQKTINISHPIIDRACASALKNQIFFSGENHKSTTEAILAKYDLKISPRDFLKIAKINKANFLNSTYKYKKGHDIFVLFLRDALCQNYPYKSPAELAKIYDELLNVENVARIAKTLFKDSFKSLQSESSTRNYANKFFALLGAIDISVKNEGHKNAIEFLSNYVLPILIPENFECEKNQIEKFYEFVEGKGYEQNDFKIRTQVSEGVFVNQILYKGNIIVQDVPRNRQEHKTDSYESIIKVAVSKIENNKIDLFSLAPKTVFDYTKPDTKRLEELEQFCNKFNLKINNFDLLNQAFLLRGMPNYTLVQIFETYEPLEFLGDAVLRICAQEVLNSNLKDGDFVNMKNKLEAFISNKNLSILTRQKGIDKLIITNSLLKHKTYADIFEALIGAIFLDGGIHGLDNVYQFLDNNFREEILNA